jgi:hypothetical protein
MIYQMILLMMLEFLLGKEASIVPVVGSFG